MNKIVPRILCGALIGLLGTLVLAQGSRSAAAYEAIGIDTANVLAGTVLQAIVVPGGEKQVVSLVTYFTGEKTKEGAVNVRLDVLRGKGNQLAPIYTRDFGAENGGFVGEGDLLHRGRDAWNQFVELPVRTVAFARRDPRCADRHRPGEQRRCGCRLGVGPAPTPSALSRACIARRGSREGAASIAATEVRPLVGGTAMQAFSLKRVADYCGIVSVAPALILLESKPLACSNAATVVPKRFEIS